MPSTTNYMQPIQVPFPPTLVSRLSIRSQADLQEQLRIKQTTERQEKQLYAPPTPAPASFKRQLEDEELVQRELAEVKEAEEPEPPMMDFPRMPLMRMTPASLGSIAEQGEFTGYFSREDPETGPTPTPTPPMPPTPTLRPPARAPVRGRPRADEKTVDQLKSEIRATGYVGYSNKNKEQLKEIARTLDIDIMR